AIDRGDRRLRSILERAAQRELPLVVPATALAQAIRNPTRQARLSRFVRQPSTHVIALDRDDATAVGLFLARTGTSDIADANVAIWALKAGHAVITSDPSDLSRIAPELQLFNV